MKKAIKLASEIIREMGLTPISPKKKIKSDRALKALLKRATPEQLAAFNAAKKVDEYPCRVRHR